VSTPSLNSLREKVARQSLANMVNHRYRDLNNYLYPSIIDATVQLRKENESESNSNIESLFLSDLILQNDSRNTRSISSSYDADVIVQELIYSDTVISGKAGDGKSTLLTKLTELFSKMELDREVYTSRDVEIKPHHKKAVGVLPILTRLSDAQFTFDRGLILKDENLNRLLSTITTLCAGHNMDSETVEFIKNQFSNSNEQSSVILLLFDGYDELNPSDGTKQNFVENLREFFHLRNKLNLEDKIKIIISTRDDLAHINELSHIRRKNGHLFEKILQIDWNPAAKIELIKSLGYGGKLNHSIIVNPLDAWMRIDLFLAGDKHFNVLDLGVNYINSTVRRHLQDRLPEHVAMYLDINNVWSELQIIISSTAFFSIHNNWVVDDKVLILVDGLSKARFQDLNYGLNENISQVTLELISSLPLLNSSTNLRENATTKSGDRRFFWNHKRIAEALSINFLKSYFSDSELEEQIASISRTSMIDHTLNIGMETNNGDLVNQRILKQFIVDELSTNDISGGYFIETEGIFNFKTEDSLQFHCYLDNNRSQIFKDIAERICATFDQDSVLFETKKISAEFISENSAGMFGKTILKVCRDENTILRKIIDSNEKNLLASIKRALISQYEKNKLYVLDAPLLDALVKIEKGPHIQGKFLYNSGTRISKLIEYISTICSKSKHSPDVRIIPFTTNLRSIYKSKTVENDSLISGWDINRELILLTAKKCFKSSSEDDFSSFICLFIKQFSWDYANAWAFLDEFLVAEVLRSTSQKAVDDLLLAIFDILLESHSFEENMIVVKTILEDLVAGSKSSRTRNLFIIRARELIFKRKPPFIDLIETAWPKIDDLTQTLFLIDFYSADWHSDFVNSVTKKNSSLICGRRRIRIDNERIRIIGTCYNYFPWNGETNDSTPVSGLLFFKNEFKILVNAFHSSDLNLKQIVSYYIEKLHQSIIFLDGISDLVRLANTNISINFNGESTNFHEFMESQGDDEWTGIRLIETLFEKIIGSDWFIQKHKFEWSSDFVFEKPYWKYTDCLRCRDWKWSNPTELRKYGHMEFICPKCHPDYYMSVLSKNTSSEDQKMSILQDIGRFTLPEELDLIMGCLELAISDEKESIRLAGIGVIKRFLFGCLPIKGAILKLMMDESVAIRKATAEFILILTKSHFEYNTENVYYFDAPLCKNLYDIDESVRGLTKDIIAAHPDFKDNS